MAETMTVNYLNCEESEISELLSNETKPFRISVHLQQYFEDIRSRAYVLVKRNDRVRNLEKRIQKIFDLPGRFSLCTNGHLLPSSEPLALLTPSDVIEVVPWDEVQHTTSSAAKVNNIQREQVQSEMNVRESQILNVNKNPSPNCVAVCHEKPKEEGNKMSTPSEERTGHSKSVEDDVDIARKLKKLKRKKKSHSKDENNYFDCYGKNYQIMNDEYSLDKFKLHALALLEKHQSKLDAGRVKDAAGQELPPRRVRRRTRHRTRRRPSASEPVMVPNAENNQELEQVANAENNQELEQVPEPEECLELEQVPEPEKCLELEQFPESEKCLELEQLPESEKDLEPDMSMDVGVEPCLELLPQTEPYLSINSISLCESTLSSVRVNGDVTRNEDALERPPRVVRALSN